MRDRGHRESSPGLTASVVGPLRDPSTPTDRTTMDPTTLPVVSTLLHAGADLLTTLTGCFEPFAGPFSAASAVIALTLAVRVLLVPLSVLQVRAERDRRRLAPQLAALRRRYGQDRERLQRAVQELYTSERVSPLAGCLPVLAQARSCRSCTRSSRTHRSGA